MTRITVMIESVNEAGATASWKHSLVLDGLVSQRRIEVAMLGLIRPVVEEHRKARRDQRVLHGQRV